MSTNTDSFPVTVNLTNNTITTIFGDTISTSIASVEHGGVTAHDWTADTTTGLFHTSDLSAEWKDNYNKMLMGFGDKLTALQRWEGNAEAVFENTKLNDLSAADQQRDREDAQREYDAAWAAMNKNAKTFGTDVAKPLDERTYLELEHTLQGDATLHELGLQGHGLNNSGYARYNGYTNDFQHNVDTTTKFVGGGLNNNENALTDFFDDSVLTHVPYAVVDHNGQLTQLNQNGALETELHKAVVAIDDTMYFRTYTAADFSQKTSHKNDHYVSKAEAVLSAEAHEAVPAGMIKTLTGEFISNTMTAGAHTWTAGADGLFHTGNLAKEWHDAYVDLVTTGGANLTAEQRLEANAEAAFENTNLKNLDAKTQQRDREDAQRQFDAEFQAMKNAHIDPNAAITAKSYLNIENALQFNAALEELAVQGHGLNNPTSARYRGYTNDFQNNIDKTTTFVGGGLDNNQNALTDFFDDVVLGHMPFATVVRNGKLIQYNQNGAAEDRLFVAARAINNTIHKAAYDADDFKHA